MSSDLIKSLGVVNKRNDFVKNVVFTAIITLLVTALIIAIVYGYEKDWNSVVIGSSIGVGVGVFGIGGLIIYIMYRRMKTGI